MIWKFIAEKLQTDQMVLLLLVVKTEGSVPGKQGFKMAVCSDGEKYGSIGGGSMEYELTIESVELIAKGPKPPFLSTRYRSEEALVKKREAYMGTQTIAFVHVSKGDLPLINEIINSINNSNNIKLIVENTGISISVSDNENILFDGDKEDWLYTETIKPLNKAYVIGAGFVGQAVSQLLKKLGFYVVLIDNRSSFYLMEENKSADEKHVIDYNEVENYVEPGQTSYVIIMTNKHLHDKDVLARFLKKDLKYIGLMGSKSKVSRFKEMMLEEGFTVEDFKNLHSPIGLSINSITPEEIAVSIAAEIIKVKNG